MSLNNCVCLTKICDIKFVSTLKSIKQIIVVLFVDVTNDLIDIVIIKTRNLFRFKFIFNVSITNIKFFLFSTIDFVWDCVVFAFAYNFHTRNQKQYDSICHMNNKNDRQILTMRNFDHDFDFFFHFVDFVTTSKIDFDCFFERCQIQQICYATFFVFIFIVVVIVIFFIFLIIFTILFCFRCYEHVWNLDWKFILSARVHMKSNANLTRTFISVIRFSVHICFLNQIFSLCYLFFRHASYIIFDLYRNERCKLHTRSHCKRSASRKKQDRCQFVTISSSARNILNSQWRWFTISCTANLSFWVLRD